MTLWLLGGHDPTHGAGVHRDLVTARRLAPSLPRFFAVTACTQQGDGRPARAWPVGEGRLRARLARGPEPSAIKVGLVPDALVATVVEQLAGRPAPLVVDPVLRASDGGALGASPEGLRPLLEVATLITPNRSEAQALVADRSLEGRELAQALAERLPGVSVLLKDGHGRDPLQVVDWSVHEGVVAPVARPRQPGPDPRGTGCALASAIAARLAVGTAMTEAVREAIAWLDRERLAWVRGPDGRAHLPG